MSNSTRSMDDIVDLLIEDPDWDAAHLADLCRRGVELALTVAGIETRAIEVSVLACDDARIQTLNSAFRGKSQATNVLSWPALDLFADRPGGRPRRHIPPDPFGATALGDIAIARQTVLAEAAAAGIRPDDHILHLILHATLHLLGYDHMNDADAALMEGLEVQALASAGVASPY